MKDRLLTYAEKRAIRTMPCGKCHKRPPYSDGSWTQKHRIIPGSKGGRYTKKNTVPRCPKCHAKEPKHGALGWILLPFAKRREAGLKGGWRVRELYPDHFSKMSRRQHALYPDLARTTARRVHERHPEQAREMGRRSWALHRDEHIAARRGRKASAETRAKLSAARRGKPSGARGYRWTPEQRAKLKGRVSPMKGKHLSTETRAKMSAARRRGGGRPRSPETRAKISAGIRAAHRAHRYPRDVN